MPRDVPGQSRIHPALRERFARHPEDFERLVQDASAAGLGAVLADAELQSLLRTGAAGPASRGHPGGRS